MQDKPNVVELVQEKAIEFVMQFYSIDKETAVRLYADEIKAAESLLQIISEE